MPASSNRRPRILLLLHDLSLSGAPRMALQVFQTLGLDVELRILSLSDGPLKAEFEALGPTSSLPEWGPPFVHRNLLSLEKRLPGIRGILVRLNGRAQSRALRKWQPDLIYINSMVALHFGRYLQLPGVPAILHVHETGSALHAQREATHGLFDSWPRHYIAVSSHTQRCLMEEGIPEAKTSVVLNFLSESTHEKLKALVQNRKPKEPSAPFVIGGAGQVHWCKGPELWLAMAAELTRTLGPERVRFKWVGGRGTPDDHDFEEQIKQLGLQSQVELVPVTPNPFEQYATFDAFSFTSREDSFGLVVLENMALGNLVACFAEGGGAPEIVGEAGIVIPEFDPIQMAERLAAVLTDSQQYADFSRKAIEKENYLHQNKQLSTLKSIIERNVAP